MTTDYFDQLDEAIKEESQGSGGIIALTVVEVGYKVFASNEALRQNAPTGKVYTQAMTFFPAGPDKASREKAKNAAKEFAVKVGSREPRNLCIRIICAAKDALSKGVPVTWKTDREFVTEVWENAKSGEASDGAKVVKPALKALGLALPWKNWARIGFAQSPSGRKDKDANGEERVALIAYPVCVFADEAEAKMGITPSANGALSVGVIDSLKHDYQVLIDAKLTPDEAQVKLISLYGKGTNALTAEQVKGALT